MTIERSEFYDRGFKDAQDGRPNRGKKLSALDKEDYDEGYFDGSYEVNRMGGAFRQGRVTDKPGT